MNRPYLHSALTGHYKRLREIDEQLVTLTKERSETFTTIEKMEKEFDDLPPFTPDEPI